MEEQTKKRRRRSAEERLADLERKQAETTEKLRAQLQAIEEQKKRLLRTPTARKETKMREQQFTRAVAVLAPEWDQRHLIAAIEMAQDADEEMLRNRGERLLEEHGKPRRGRRPRNA